MAAPAFVLMTDNERDPRVRELALQVTSKVHAARPDLTVDTAFTRVRSQISRGALDRVFGRLSKGGVDEVVVAPLSFGPAQGFSAAVDDMRDQHPELAITCIRPMSLNGALLNAVDRNLRAALRRVHARELDALVLAYDAPAPASDSLDGAGIVRLTRAWSAHHKLPASAAYLSGSTAHSHVAITDAVRSFRRAGRRNVAVGVAALTPGRGLDRALDAAFAAGAMAVSAPIGDSDELVEQLQLAYTVAAFDLIRFAPAAAADSTESVEQQSA